MSEITIREIEERVASLYPNHSAEDQRIGCLAFAILKEGVSIPKLEAFTKYDRAFLLYHVNQLTSHGELFTGSLSEQFILKRCPGSEDLIERITGRRITNERKEGLKLNAETNSHTLEDATCNKSASCDKPVGHLGRCKGQGGSVSGRTTKKKTTCEVNPFRLAAKKTSKPIKPKPTKRAKAPDRAALKVKKRQAQIVSRPAPGSAPTVMLVRERDGEDIQVNYNDDSLRVVIEGRGRDRVIRALDTISANLKENE